MKPLQSARPEKDTKDQPQRTYSKQPQNMTNITSFTYCLGSYNSLEKFYSKSQPNIFQSPEGTREESISFLPEKITFAQTRNNILTKPALNIQLQPPKPQHQKLRVPLPRQTSHGQNRAKKQAKKQLACINNGDYESCIYLGQDQKPGQFEQYFSSVFEKKIELNQNSKPFKYQDNALPNIQQPNSFSHPTPRHFSTPQKTTKRKREEIEEYLQHQPIRKRVKFISQVKSPNINDSLQNDSNTPRKLAAKVKRQQISSRFQSPEYKPDSINRQSTLFKRLMDLQISEVSEGQNISQFIKEWFEKSSKFTISCPQIHQPEELLQKKTSNIKFEDDHRDESLLGLRQFFDGHERNERSQNYGQEQGRIRLLDGYSQSKDEKGLENQLRFGLERQFYNDEIFKSHHEDEGLFQINEFLLN